MRTQEAREVLVVHLAADVDETILRDDLVERGEDEVGVPHGHQVRIPHEAQVLRGRPVLLEGLEVGSWDPVVLAQERLPVEADLDPQRVRPRDRREDRGVAGAGGAVSRANGVRSLFLVPPVTVALLATVSAPFVARNAAATATTWVKTYGGLERAVSKGGGATGDGGEG